VYNNFLEKFFSSLNNHSAVNITFVVQLPVWMFTKGINTVITIAAQLLIVVVVLIIPSSGGGSC
jgi:hypothetical protein